MSTLHQAVAPVHQSLGDAYAARAYEVCRFMELPPGTACGPKVDAIRAQYSTLTGRELPIASAIRVLDRILAERFDVPFPAAYSQIADVLFREDYCVDGIHAIIGHLRRGGPVRTCPGLEAGLYPVVAELMPRAVPCRCRDEE